MRIAIMGSGGLGAFYGGLLARGGEDVVFLARGANLVALQMQGLTVKLLPHEGEFHLTVHATDNPPDIGVVDLVWCCVKTYDLDTAMIQMTPLIGPDTMILTVQNGVDAPEHLATVFGSHHVLGGIALGGATLEAPGIVVQKTATRGPVVFGELDGGISPRAERLRDTFRAADFLAEVHLDIRVAIWEKFMMLGAGLGISALTRLTYGEMFACPEIHELIRGVIQEMASVARAKGIRLSEDAAERLFTTACRFPGSFRGSMYFDLINGRRLELDAVHGAVMRMGREFHIPTPLNFAIHAMLKPHAAGANINP
jgi:2-dehydropantoate 2-reductase